MATKSKRRRRTESEMRNALAVVEAKREQLRIHPDDEHDAVLADAITELLELRAITAKLMQTVGAAHQEAAQSLKNMSIQ